MEINENTYHKIQKYLDGEMTDAERRVFEAEKKSNPDLARVVELNAEMRDLLADSPENELRKNLQILNERVTKDTNKSDFSWKYLLWLLPFFLIAGFWFFNSKILDDNLKMENSVETVSPVVPEKTPSDSDEKNQTLKDIDDLNEESDTPEKPSRKNEPARDLSPDSDAEKIISRPIAADFTPNPSLEFLIENNLRNNDFEITIERRQPDVRLNSPTEVVAFQFSAVLKSEENLSDRNFKLHLFSNKKSDFEDFRPLLSFDLSLDQIELKSFRIDFQKNMNLKEGLYYYLIEELGREKIYFVEKFEVNW